jgi:hypothetical protein
MDQHGSGGKVLQNKRKEFSPGNNLLHKAEINFRRYLLHIICKAQEKVMKEE